MDPRWKHQVRSHVFRVWTALVVLGGYIYGWLYVPELLTWWKRTTNLAIEALCGALPYPWGDRIEATIGNFGLWVQISLAVIAFRLLMWLLARGLGLTWPGLTWPGRRRI